MAIDWDTVETQYSRPPYVENGKYKVKVSGIEVKELNTGSIAVEFKFEEKDGFAFPKATDWMTFKEGKDGWRQHHTKNIFMMLGKDEAGARKYVEEAEASGDKAKILNLYGQIFKRAAAGKPEVEIEVRQQANNPKYQESVFTDPNVRMSDNNTKSTAKSDDILDNNSNSLTADDLLDSPF